MIYSEREETLLYLDERIWKGFEIDGDRNAEVKQILNEEGRNYEEKYEGSHRRSCDDHDGGSAFKNNWIKSVNSSRFHLKFHSSQTHIRNSCSLLLGTVWRIYW